MHSPNIFPVQLMCCESILKRHWFEKVIVHFIIHFNTSYHPLSKHQIFIVANTLHRYIKLSCYVFLFSTQIGSWLCRRGTLQRSSCLVSRRKDISLKMQTLALYSNRDFAHMRVGWKVLSLTMKEQCQIKEAWFEYTGISTLQMTT